MAPLFVIYLIWIAWVVSWWAAALWSNPAVKRAGGKREFLYRVLAVAGAFLLFGFYSNRYDMMYRFWQTPSGVFGWSMAGLVLIGFAFSWWARVYLGPLWSSSVTRKHAHHVVDTGPYALVRHPIYTGITLATFATALVAATPTSFLGAAIMTAGWVVKARLEERFLREELGAEAYDAYSRRVPMLVPFWPL